MGHGELTGNQLPAEPEKATLEGRNKILGFWFFLGGEMVLFGSLFATFIGLRNQIADGPAPQELINLTMTAVMTLVLLTSSLTSVMAIQAMHRKDTAKMYLWFIVTFLLGLTFLILEIIEFVEYVHHGHKFTTSAYSSAFYTLVGFHGAHVTFGLGWLLTLLIPFGRKGLTVTTAPKMYVFGLYWHFVDVVWVFVFTIVYLMGKVG